MKNLLVLLFVFAVLQGYSQKELKVFYNKDLIMHGNIMLEITIYDNDSLVLWSRGHAGLGKETAKLKYEGDTIRIYDYEGWNDMFLNESSFLVIRSEDEWSLFHEGKERKMVRRKNFGEDE